MPPPEFARHGGPRQFLCGDVQKVRTACSVESFPIFIRADWVYEMSNVIPCFDDDDHLCREKMYECLVEGCPKKFKGDFQREKHLIDAHRESN